MKKLIFVPLLLLLFSCAATYKPPVTEPTVFEKSLNASKENIFNVSKKVLTLEGYQIQNSDKDAGIITTSFVQKMNLDETHCDCGTTMGLPYIKDKRTITNVSISIIASNNKLTIKANINGEYLKNDTVHGKTFDCVSKGKIEAELFDKIKASF